MSASLYDPDQEALPGSLEYTQLLSQRDVSSTVPINFVTHPGVSLTAACFPRSRYDSTSATKCVSNLLAAGFRRLEVDLYWDVSRTSWSFCPVQLGEVEPQLSVTQESTTSQTPSRSASLTSNDLVVGTSVSTTSASSGTRSPGTGSPSLKNLRPRQTDSDEQSTLSVSSQSSMFAVTLPSPTTTQTEALSNGESTSVTEGTSPESTGTPSDGTLLQVGDYICSPQLDFHQFLNVLYGHFIATEDNLNATTKYIVLNLHAAASASGSSNSDISITPDNLPQGSNLLSSLISANNSQYLYTPQLLSGQRADLNDPSSWFTVRQSISPDSSFYRVDRNNSIASTPDGWPSESVIEFARARRMLAGFGTIDAEMQDYDLAQDASTIFAPGCLTKTQDVTFASNGSLTSGCFSHVNDPSISNANSSWAIPNNIAQDSAAGPSLDIHIAQAGNLTDCGINPILNTTLLNTSADVNVVPYKAYAQSTIWSWASDEPRSLDANDDPDNIANRCAVLNATSSHWQSHECGNSHHAACRVNDAGPYTFVISDSSAAYAKAEAACRNGVSFATARTSLENSYLLQEWRSYRSDFDIDDELLWIDFNDLDIAGCWVIGQNSTCPYQDRKVGEGRRVIVPTVAAVVVFVLAILTIFIKCAANRRNTRRTRRKGDDGWDYEGVPS